MSGDIAKCPRDVGGGTKSPPTELPVLLELFPSALGVAVPFSSPELSLREALSDHPTQLVTFYHSTLSPSQQIITLYMCVVVFTYARSGEQSSHVSLLSV